MFHTDLEFIQHLLNLDSDKYSDGNVIDFIQYFINCRSEDDLLTSTDKTLAYILSYIL